MIIIGEEIGTWNNLKISSNSHRSYAKQYSRYSKFTFKSMDKFKFVKFT